MERSAAVPRLLRTLNEQKVLETIRVDAPISRAEISRRAGISKPTVSLALRTLLEAGLVRETDGRAGTPNYGATFFEPVPDAALALALDLGARFLRGAICDLRGEVRARADVEVTGADALEAADAAADLKERLVAAAGVRENAIDGAVVGVPGVVESGSGRLALAENVPRLEGLDMAGELTARLGLAVTVENDVNLAALGEQWRGVAAGVDDFAFLSIGTGLGAGLVLHGELHRGHNGAAGEVDYAVGVPGESPADPSAPAIAAHAESLGAPPDLPTLFGAARGGDAQAIAVVAEEARRIAAHIAPIAAVADVRLVVLGGGIGINGDLLLEPIRATLAKRLPYPPRVEVSSLGDAAVLTGALALALRSALDNVSRSRAR
jgi:predicted NBD/HSP70 family sugar kinase